MKCEVLIDWLTFSIKTDKPNEVIRDFLNMDPDLFQEMGYSINGYQKCKAFSSILVCYEGRENDCFNDMGVCVSMSGTGCRAFETYTRYAVSGDKASSPFVTLFSKLVECGNAHVSRLDVACDDKSGVLDMDEFRFRFDEHLIRTRCRDTDYHDKKKGKECSGRTFYIGSKSSSFRTRIYDKALEQGVAGPWIRVEMVMRGKNGDSFISELVKGEEIGQLAAKVLNDKLSFIEDDDSNISRCSVCKWWAAFVEEVGKVRLVAREVIQHSVEHLADWLRLQVAPTLYIMSQTLGFPALWRMAEGSKERLSSKQEALIRDWQNIQLAGREDKALPAAIPAV